MRRLESEHDLAIRVVDYALEGDDVGGRLETFQADLRDPASAHRAVEGCTHVVHLAAIVGGIANFHKLPHTLLEVNNGLYNAVFRAALDAGVERLVYVSSSMVFERATEFPTTEEHVADTPIPESAYGFSKLAGEAYCRACWESYRVPAISLRYFNVFGPGQDPASEYAAVVTRFIAACLDGTRPTIYGDGEQSRDFAFLDDVVQANLLAARAPEAAFGRAFNIGGGAEPTSVNRLLRLIASACGVEPEPVHQPERPGDIRRSEADVGLARTVLGFEPKVDVADGLRRTIEWFRDLGRTA